MKPVIEALAGLSKGKTWDYTKQSLSDLELEMTPTQFNEFLIVCKDAQVDDLANWSTEIMGDVKFADLETLASGMQSQFIWS